jgi:hypothetical protein
VAASNNGVSFSAGVDIQVTVTSFALGAAPASATVVAGQSASIDVTVTPQGGPFDGTVTLGCSNLPAGATCTFDPPTVRPGAAPGRSTVTIATTARTTSAPASRGARPVSRGMASSPPAGGRAGGAVAALLALGCALWVPRAAGAERRRWALGLIAAGALIAFHAACGGGTTTPNPQPTAKPAVSLSPASLSFGAQAVQTTSAAQTISLTNSGTAALTVSGITASGDFAQTNTCGSVAAGGQCAIAVSFTPSAAGARAGTLTITDNAANSPQAVGLSGTGGIPAGGTPAGTYQVGVTGASGTMVQAGTVTLVVQ